MAGHPAIHAFIRSVAYGAVLAIPYLFQNPWIMVTTAIRARPPTLKAPLSPDEVL